MTPDTRLPLRRVSMRFVVVAFTLLALGLSACGGGDEGTPRSFSNEDEGDDVEETLPESVKSDIALSFKKGHFIVEVAADRDYCLDGRTGAIFEKPRRGKADKVGQFKTDEVGVDNVKVRKPGGTYYATLAKGSFAKYGAVSTCSQAKSRNVRV